jgi:hypothetical protein
MLDHHRDTAPPYRQQQCHTVNKIGTGSVPITLNYGGSVSLFVATVGTVTKSKTGSSGLITLDTVGTVSMF